MIEPTDKHPRNHQLRIDRGIQEMLGIVRGVLCDGEISDQEANALNEWVQHNDELHGTWPVFIIADRLRKIFEDKRIDEDEKTELKELLEKITGSGLGKSTTLPISSPQPELLFKNKIYVFTGKFAYGTRQRCEETVIARGALCKTSVTHKTDYLIIGEIGSDDWKFSAWGMKIREAAQNRDAGFQVHIIAEEHWVKSLREN